MNGRIDIKLGSKPTLSTSIHNYTASGGTVNVDLSNYYTKVTVDSKLNNKVDVVEGKGLSTNDYTTIEKNKLNSLNNYDDSTLKKTISYEAVRATAAEAQLQKNIDGKTVDLSNYALSSQLSDYETITGHNTDVTALQSAIDAKLNKSDYHVVDLTHYYNKVETDTKLNGKVSTIEGKGLSTNDYTTEEKTKLQGLSNYDDSGVKKAISDEVTRATAAEVILQKNIDSKTVDTSNYVTSSAHASDVTTLQSEIDTKLNKSDYTSVDLTHYYTKATVDDKLLAKVDVVEGKGLSTNDYTTVEKNKLNSLNNYDDSTIKQSITDEATRATAAELQLQKNIDNKQDKGNYALSSELTKYETSSAHATDIAILQGAIYGKLNKSDYTPTDLTNYYRKKETSGATEIATAIAAISTTKVLTQAEYDAIVFKDNNVTYIITA